MTTKAAIYARISSDPNETALGVARQLKDCLKLAERKGWSVVEQYVDNDVSATSGKPRPEYLRLMRALADGQLEALVVWDVDRLTRTPRELEDVVELAEKRGIALASVGGEVDLATPQGRLTARIKGSVARHETEQLSRRVKAKMEERAAAGLGHGPVSYGWRRELDVDDRGRVVGSRDVLHPEQAQVVRDCISALLGGDSLRAITARLNADGVASPKGGTWATTTLRSVMLRPRNAGLVLHRGQVVGRGQWEPLVDEDTHKRVVAILADPNRRTSPASSAVKYLLSGIARCGVCGGALRVLAGTVKNGRTDTYICHVNYCVRRHRQALDDFVTAHVLGLLALPDAIGALTRSDDAQVVVAREKAAALRARLDLAADACADGEIDVRQLARITSKLRPELDALEATVRAASSAPDLLDLAGPDIAQRWEAVPLARKRAVIDLLLEVVVDKATLRGGAAHAFDPTSVRVTEKA